MRKLIEKIKNKHASVGIVGVGYVGEALGRAINESGFKVIGFVKDNKKINPLTNKLPPGFRVTANKNLLLECDIVCICVATPLNSVGDPDYSILITAVSEVAQKLKKGQLIIVESSVAPGTSKKVILQVLSARGLTVEKDFYLGYSPERVDPGNTKYDVKNIPKVVSGIGKKSLKLTSLFYERVVNKVIPVSSCEVAEMTKILENVFRLVNISLINEIADYTKTLGINIWEVISAASTKPFGFLPHYPGTGAGGYCIPVLPKYLLESASNNRVNLPLVKMAIDVNKRQPEKVARQAIKMMNGIVHNQHSNGVKPQALIVGISYKEELDDTRESTALKLWNKLEEKGVKVHYHDPYVKKLNGYKSSELDQSFLKEMDVIILTTPHKDINYELLISSERPLLDVKNALNGYQGNNIYQL